MPTYRFEFHEALRTCAVRGIKLDDDETATAEAVQTAEEMLLDGVVDDFDRFDWAIKIFNQSDEAHAVAVIRFSDIAVSKHRS
ncbi:DUF6894 family protein [Phyllobacterium zundukense]|uniref:DUF6894 domain-containing protein n=1 Tax=Phyllobacterium zundukense TaxID=1867719 RepID=A0A2N9VQQ5_9HYPH|nr:hypothetical protein [Phyllobacterium zundukense]ATU91472.1 hypothetical protein BLM14_07385 [Phyllobacterium zundukense]PIO41823.1 hypothetical protein B5P45_26525 [Phyllobacterium zundukense]